MKAATGELNLTIITVLAIGAVLAFFWVLWPTIKDAINIDWDNTEDPTGSGYVETVKDYYM